MEHHLSKPSHCIHFTKDTCGPGASSSTTATRLFFVLTPFLPMAETLGDSDTWRREPLMVSANIPTSSYALSSLGPSTDSVSFIFTALWGKSIIIHFLCMRKLRAKSQKTGSSSPRNEGQRHSTNSSPKTVGPKTGSSYTTPEKWKKKITSHSCLPITSVKFLPYFRFFPKP